MNDSGKKAILIVDDQASWRNLLTELLEDEYEVTSLASTTEALATLWTQDPKFHVAILDIRLEDNDPGDESGLTLVQELNRRGDFTHAIVVTGYPTIKTATKAIGELAAFRYLEKYPEDGRGFNHQQFKQIVRTAVNNAEQKRKENKVVIQAKKEIDRGRLRRNLTEYFSDTELRSICFDFGIGYENLSGNSKVDKGLALAIHMERLGLLEELLNAGRQQRPNLEW